MLQAIAILDNNRSNNPYEQLEKSIYSQLKSNYTKDVTDC